MGLTPLFELFAGLLSFRLANCMQRIGWSCSSEKSNMAAYMQVGMTATYYRYREVPPSKCLVLIFLNTIVEKETYLEP